MLIRYFTSNMPFQQLLGILLTAVLMWMGFFTGHETWSVQPEVEPLAGFIVGVANKSHLWSGILALFIFLLQAFWLNYLAQLVKLTSSTSYLTAFLFLLIALSLQGNFLTGAALFGNFFSLGIIHSLINAYYRKNTLRSVFHASLFAGLGSLFYFPLLGLGLFIIIALIVYREINVRAIIFTVFGLIPSWAGISLFNYWQQEPWAYFNALSNYLANYNLQLHGSMPLLLVAAMIFLFLLFSIFFTHIHIIEQVIRKRRTIMVFTWYVIFILILSGYAVDVLQQVVLLAPVIAVFFTHRIESITKRGFAELTLWIFIVIISVYRLQNWLQITFEFEFPVYKIF